MLILVNWQTGESRETGLDGQELPLTEDSARPSEEGGGAKGSTTQGGQGRIPALGLAQ